MATMLARYLAVKGYVLGPSAGGAGSFSDADSISGWATEAMELMRDCRIITGRPGNVADPRGNATRAEACTIFMRLIRAVLNR
jgi:hypothetical protein